MEYLFRIYFEGSYNFCFSCWIVNCDNDGHMYTNKWPYRCQRVWTVLGCSFKPYIVNICISISHNLVIEIFWKTSSIKIGRTCIIIVICILWGVTNLIVNCTLLVIHLTLHDWKGTNWWSDLECKMLNLAVTFVKLCNSISWYSFYEWVKWKLCPSFRKV